MQACFFICFCLSIYLLIICCIYAGQFFAFKKFQLLHNLESPCASEHDLLEAALAVRPKKIVIKRPLKGAYLDGRRPDYSYTGKAIRFDCIIPR